MKHINSLSGGYRLSSLFMGGVISRLFTILLLTLFSVGGAWADDVLIWSEDWTGATTATSKNNAATPSAYKATLYSQSSNAVYCRNDKVGGGEAPELMLSKGETWTITLSELQGYTSGDKLHISFQSNNTNAAVTINGQAVNLLECAGDITLSDNAVTLQIVFSCKANTRIDNVVLTYSNNTGSQKLPSSLIFSSPTASYILGQSEPFAAPVLTTSPEVLDVVYSSNNPNVAQVNESTGDVTIVAEGTTTITASFAGNDEYSASDASYILTVIDASVSSYDELTYSKLDFGDISDTGYKLFTVSGLTSGAEYSGQANKANNQANIQLRKQSPAGIVTTKSGGKVAKIKLTYHSSSNNTTRYVTVYGKDTPYAGPADLYDNAKQGAEITSFAGGTTQEYIFEVPENKQYKYIGFLASAAIYIDNIKVIWAENTSAPEASIAASDIDFGNTLSGATRELKVSVDNLTAPVTTTLIDGSAFNVSGELSQGTGGTLTITVTATTAGVYEDILVLTSGSCTTNVNISANVLMLDGNGTKEAPYTVNDVKALSINNTSTKAWVRGYILGSYNSNATNNLDATSNNTNIAVGESMEPTCAKLPVALPAGDIRVALNVKDNPANIGREVLVYGSLETYFSTSGVKNTSDYWLASTTHIILNDNNCGFATYYNGQENILLPDGIDAWTYALNNGGNLEASKMFEAGDVLPAGVGVVLYSPVAGTYTLTSTLGYNVLGTAEDFNEINILRGTDTAEEVEADDDETLYILGKGSKGVGFYQAYADGGNSFTNGAHKAYLAVPKTGEMAVRSFFSLGIGDVETAIKEAVERKQTGTVYNINGMRVNDMSRPGLYIVNGKKIVK